MCLLAEAFDGGEDFIGGFDPSEGLGVSVVLIDEGTDISFKLSDGRVYAALDLLSGELGEPALHLIDPRPGGGREVNIPMGSSRQPSLDLRGLVGGVMVHDDMNVEFARNTGVDLFEEVKKLGCAVALVALADDEAGGDVECSEERRRAMPDIVRVPCRQTADRSTA